MFTKRLYLSSERPFCITPPNSNLLLTLFQSMEIGMISFHLISIGWSFKKTVRISLSLTKIKKDQITT